MCTTSHTSYTLAYVEDPKKIHYKYSIFFYFPPILFCFLEQPLICKFDATHRSRLVYLGFSLNLVEGKNFFRVDCRIKILLLTDGDFNFFFRSTSFLCHSFAIFSSSCVSGMTTSSVTSFVSLASSSSSIRRSIKIVQPFFLLYPSILLYFSEQPVICKFDVTHLSRQV